MTGAFFPRGRKKSRSASVLRRERAHFIRHAILSRGFADTFSSRNINCEDLFPRALGLNQIEHPAALPHEQPRVVAKIGARRHEAADEFLTVAPGNDEEFRPEVFHVLANELRISRARENDVGVEMRILREEAPDR